MNTIDESGLTRLSSRVVRSFVVRSGRMSDAQKRSYEQLAPDYTIPWSESLLDVEKAFGRKAETIIEIGFGMGQATAHIASEHPQTNYVGVEVHRPGVGRLLWEIEERQLKNLRIIEHDAVEVLEKMFSPDSVDGFHIFFPDPWPKKKHHKRRLITRPFTDLLCSRLKPGGYLYAVTDWEDYGYWALEELRATKGLHNSNDDFAPRQAWRPITKFEKKGLDKAHKIFELYFTKKEAHSDE